MHIVNIHSRKYPVPASALGRLLDSLSSHNDLLWPHHLWPRMAFDRRLSIGAAGGHGPIRYYVEEYAAGNRVRFRFTAPMGFRGYHGYEVIRNGGDSAELRQILEMNTHGMALISWPLIFRPLHDALIEDSLTCADVQLGLEPKISAWSWWVRLLRRLVSSGNSVAQQFSNHRGSAFPG